MASEFSHRTRQKSIERFQTEIFDILIIGGGITGAACARDGASRGLRVALVEKNDFAWGTSSRSSKLIHGGLRYLENLEFPLVFESLAERARLLKNAPNTVRPLQFYLPVYEGDRHGRMVLSAGLCLYDLLALGRTPGMHGWLSAEKLLKALPGLKPEGLKGGLSYFDASMFDDRMTVDTLRSAHEFGADVANYVEAISPLWDGERICGYHVLNRESGRRLDLRATLTIFCGGPWTDQLAEKTSKAWKPWLAPSKGIHLIFDLGRIPLSGAVIMKHPKDGRISFVIPRPDFGAGVVIVGTTDGPTSKDPEKATIDGADIEYLMDLLKKYFPTLGLKSSDIISAYVGVRPLMAGGEKESLQKISREHHIDQGPGGVIIAAGGKYTTHRTMAEEILDYALSKWSEAHAKGTRGPLPKLKGTQTKLPLDMLITQKTIAETRAKITKEALPIPDAVVDQYGGEALEIFASNNGSESPPGFPLLVGQFKHAIAREMVLHLEDFFFRRQPLYSTRSDHGIPWAAKLAKILAEARGGSAEEETNSLLREIEARSAWRKS